MQHDLIKYLFSDFLEKFKVFFTGLESQFINNLVISLQYNVFKQGEVIQTAMFECTYVYMIGSGSVAVCESSCYKEPILVYGRGAVINLYQIMMEQQLPFNFVALTDQCFKYTNDRGEILMPKEDHLSKRSFLDAEQVIPPGHSARNLTKKPYAELYSLDKKKFNELIALFPDSARLMQDYAVEQIEHLSAVRQLKEHFHPANFSEVPYYRKNQIFLN